MDVYRNGNIVTLKHNGEEETLSGLTSRLNGIFWIGNLPYGTYYLKETTARQGMKPVSTSGSA